VEKTKSKLWSRLSITLGLSGVTLWIGHFYFWFSYFDSSPRTPDPSSGHIVPLNNHGYIAYLTAQ